MRSRRALALALAATTACATVPRPEGPVPVEAGKRVRVTLASRVATGPLQGEVVSISPDTLVVAREEGGERRLARNQVEEIEVSIERTRDAFGSAGNGLLAASPFLALGGIGLLLLPPDYKGAAFTFTLITAGGAVFVGALMGASTDQDVWVDALWPAVPTTASPDSAAASSVSAEGD